MLIEKTEITEKQKAPHPGPTAPKGTHGPITPEEVNANPARSSFRHGLLAKPSSSRANRPKQFAALLKAFCDPNSSPEAPIEEPPHPENGRQSVASGTPLGAEEKARASRPNHAGNPAANHRNASRRIPHRLASNHIEMHYDRQFDRALDRLLQYRAALENTQKTKIAHTNPGN